MFSKVEISDSSSFPMKSKDRGRSSFSTTGQQNELTRSNSSFSSKSFKESPDFSLSHPAKQSTSLKDLNVYHTDYIAERKASIKDHYSLLNPPIGKGPNHLI